MLKSKLSFKTIYIFLIFLINIFFIDLKGEEFDKNIVSKDDQDLFFYNSEIPYILSSADQLNKSNQTKPEPN